MTKQELIKYFENKLKKDFEYFNIYIQGDTICSDIDYCDDDFIEKIDFKKCKEIFPNFKMICVSYEYPSMDEYTIGNETAQELHFSGIDIENITKNKIDKFCDIFKYND